MQLVESQVNASALVEIFGAAFMDVTDFDADSFRVKGEKVPVNVTVDSDRKLIKFHFFNRMKNINMATASQIANKMNEEYIFVSFSAVEYEGTIFFTSSYYMTFKKGLIKYQLVDNLKTFERITLEAAMAEFGDYF
ncbi:hypothetical protein FY034_16410 [Trichlorobacter lovleyi]|uniref:hypothetical protein n=1 Tax=Trichlorobacter lovleyi TaxID=313985 RepID=UPI00223EEABE|nr:hypothetical protein [Trichlorobacter lovleyi]QOX80450.1 hypothetical protein FY034_16410 [Trichlorobacter lovleyi]